MSGGSWDYISHKFDEVADRLDPAIRYSPEVAAARRKLGELVRLVAIAMHDIEWVDSCDWGPGDELPAIKAVFQFVEGAK